MIDLVRQPCVPVLLYARLSNKWFARDTSKKIRAVIKAKAERGERVGTSVPYGYKRDPDIKGHLLVNEETAPVIRMIFELCAKGIGPKNIGNILRDKKIYKPTFYRYQTDGVYGAVTDTDTPYNWTSQTISDILKNEIYLGHTINCKTRVVSFKDKRVVDVPKNEQYRFESTHEAIIDQMTWDAVQKVRQGKRRRNNMGEIDKYSGLLFCADCGSKLYFVRGKSIPPKHITLYAAVTANTQASNYALPIESVRSPWMKSFLKRYAKQPITLVLKPKSSSSL